MPIGVSVVSVDPTVDFSYMNDNFSLFYRTTREALRDPDSFWEAVYEEPVFRESIKRRVLEDISSGDQRRMHWEDVPITREGKSTTYISAMNTPIPNENLQIATVWDVTERMNMINKTDKLEYRLQQAQKMEAIGTLAGGIAHDFNNILGAIIGYAEMAKEDSIGNEAVLHDLDRVLQASDRASALVKQILSFSRQNSLEYMIFQLSTNIKSAIELLRPSLPSTIEIVEDIHDVGLIFADPTQLSQVMMNLCTNAFHAMEETGGELHLTLKETFLGEEDLIHKSKVKAGLFAHLTVRDTGTGIPHNIQARMFDPYYSTKGVGKGTGMGLSIVHGIVDACNGFISVYSEIDKGAAFHVFLPIAEGSGTVARPRELLEIPGGTERILFVDDEAFLTEMNTSILERLGYHITAKTDSTEALEVFKANPYQFDLIITDHTMPKMTGYDLSREIIQVRPDIPIILCTGFSSTVSEERALSIGISAYAMKPLARNDIALLIRKVLDGENDA